MLADNDGRSTTLDDSEHPSSIRNMRYTTSDFMPRHLYNANWIYELPFGLGRGFAPASGFLGKFIGGWQASGLMLFVLPPRSPKLNGHVERAQRTHTEEFYEVIPDSFQLPILNRQLRAWERTYNSVRPHQALGYLTPHQFLSRSHSLRKDPFCVTNLLDENTPLTVAA